MHNLLSALARGARNIRQPYVFGSYVTVDYLTSMNIDCFLQLWPQNLFPGMLLGAATPCSIPCVYIQGTTSLFP